MVIFLKKIKIFISKGQKLKFASAKFIASARNVGDC